MKRPILPNPGITENGKERCNAPLVVQGEIVAHCGVFVRPGRRHRGPHRLTWWVPSGAADA